MNEVERIKKELKIINEARDKATKIISKAMPHYNDYLIGHDKDGAFVLANMNRNMTNWENDLDFFILSANRIAQLTKVIEVMAEALISIKRYETMTNYPQHEINHALLVEVPHEASETLEKVVEILKGE